MPASRRDTSWNRRRIGRELSQNLQDGRLHLSDAAQQRIVQGAPRFQTEIVSVHRDYDATTLKFGQDFGCLAHRRTSPSSSLASFARGKEFNVPIFEFLGFFEFLAPLSAFVFD
jgi:hypothetical protein